MGLYFCTGAAGLNPSTVISNETLSRHNLYGVTFNGINSEGKPLYNAIDQKWIPATTTDPGVDTWKNLAPFNVKKCITDYDASEQYKRKVLAYEEEEEYNSMKASNTGDRMVEFPLGYYYRPDKWTFIVSPDPIEGFQPSPACDLGNGTILNGFRLSEFDLCYIDSTPRSIPGATPWARVEAQIIKDALKTKGQYMETFGAWCWINFLRIIKQGNLNSQKVNGMGIYSDGARTMTEDNIQGLDGYVGIDANDNVRTLGLQNFYGHIFDFLHNVIVRSASKAWIKKDFIHAESWPTYSDAVSDGWEELSVPLPPGGNNSGWISELAWNSAEPWALYPSKYGGNDVEPIGDYCYKYSYDPFAVVLVGGKASSSSSIGSLCWESDSLLSDVSDGFGTRSLEAF